VPFKPKHPCNAPGCPALTLERFCLEHKREHHRRFDATRGTPAERGYGRRWQAIRMAHLMAEPLCRECGKAGRVVAAREVDHIVAKVRGGSDDESNLQSLCTPCHSRKTAREVGFHK